MKPDGVEIDISGEEAGKQMGQRKKELIDVLNSMEKDFFVVLVYDKDEARQQTISIACMKPIPTFCACKTLKNVADETKESVMKQAPQMMKDILRKAFP